MPTHSMPYCRMAVLATARMTALSPGQSPPPVKIPMRMGPNPIDPHPTPAPRPAAGPAWDR